MGIMGLRTFYTFLSIFLLSLVWGHFFSEKFVPYFAIFLLSSFILYQAWNQIRLLRAIQNDDLIGRPRGLGIWRTIFAQLELKSKSWRQEVLRSEVEYNRFIQAVQASPNGLVMLDDTDQIEWCNNICREHLRLDPMRDARQPITFLLRHPEFVKYMQAKSFHEPLNLDHMGVNGNLTLLLQIYPYGENRKLLLSQDVSILKRNESIRQDFVANVSHELRTPLTVLNGFLETILDIPLTEQERKKYLNMMRVQSTRMLSLVEELLILTRLDNSPISPKTSEVKVPELMVRILEDARNVSNGNHIIRSSVHSSKGILGAENEIFSAFSNLITNAIRYTPEGGTIHIYWDDCANGGATFAVRDTGIGIAPEHIPRLTERFYRVDRSRSRDTGGTGLGLAIVKHVASRHGAELEIESTPAVGSVFSLRFNKDRLVDYKD
jgi:two-component system, OmpR family, phosphate regulon sensor histidine kinase PhoR